jgi:hypothetical protein
MEERSPVMAVLDPSNFRMNALSRRRKVMKSTSFIVLVFTVAVLAASVRADACGPNGGRSSVYPNNAGPYNSNSYSINGSSPYAAYTPASSTSTTASVPRANITVLPSGAGDATANTAAGTSKSGPQGAVHVVADAETANVVKTTSKVDPTLTKAAEATPPAKSEDSTIVEALKGLVGTWKAVARQGDGELSTIDLQLDNHGWAKLTVPGSDGKPSTVTRRVELDDKGIKLTGGDAALTLGKLVEFNSRQMVLDRADGQITFVRP